MTVRADEVDTAHRKSRQVGKIISQRRGGAEQNKTRPVFVLLSLRRRAAARSLLHTAVRSRGHFTVSCGSDYS